MDDRGSAVSAGSSTHPPTAPDINFGVRAGRSEPHRTGRRPAFRAAPDDGTEVPVSVTPTHLARNATSCEKNESTRVTPEVGKVSGYRPISLSKPSRRTPAPK
ncbi:hypothetical protein GCM10010104_00780 [Streptomyces indiaensis]|uniref:Uncharacterized protein n=1 Tax=Streptomyces indiaensis TaxID=284033 RepID=A0ABN3UWL5_9ACTN